MIRVAFVIGGYPPQEHRRRADAALLVSLGLKQSRIRWPKSTSQ